MVYLILRRKGLLLSAAVLLLCAALLGSQLAGVVEASKQGEKKDFIKYVEFNVPYEALDHALSLDIESHGTDTPLHWDTLLAYCAAKNGGDFTGFKPKKLDELAELLKSGQTMEELTKDLKYYSYYSQAYSAVLGGLVGEFEEQVPDQSVEGGVRWEKKYGLMAYSPIAKNYPYEDYDDFGASRDCGYKRQHLGHDMMGQVGTPVVAVESGVVEALGWNQYGGWRLGIRSLDGKRYYYYAHLRKNYPYNAALQVGSVVAAGDVIGYLGRTGYSPKENVNNIEVPHLHFGLELVFDESQKESDNEIWVDVYPLVRLLRRHQSETVKVEGTKEHVRVYGFRTGS